MSESKKTVAQKAHKPITMDSEFVSIHNGTKVHYVECPKDFLDYFYKFIEFKKDNLWMLLAARKYRHEKLKSMPEMNNETLSDYSDKAFDKLIDTQSKAYTPNELSQILDIPLDDFITNYNVPFPVRPVFLQLFDTILWSFMQYLYDKDLEPEYDTLYDYLLDDDPDEHLQGQNIKFLLAELVRNTVHTDKKVKCPANIDLTRYDFTKAKQIPDKHLSYGKLFIEAANLYHELREYWLGLVIECPPKAELFEKMVTDTAKFGYKSYHLRYRKSCGRGGTTKEQEAEVLKGRVYRFYELFKDERISMAALANKILTDKRGFFYSQSYEDLKKQEEKKYEKYVLKCTKKGIKPKEKKRERNTNNRNSDKMDKRLGCG